MWNNRRPNPSPTSNTELRNRQITSVLQRFPEAKPVSPDRSVIDIPLLLPSGTRLTFRLQLDQGFPSKPPSLRLLGQAAHPSLDHTGNVRHPRIQNWSPHFNLADAVGDVLNMFYTSPPRITAASSSPSPSPSPSPSSSSPSPSPSPHHTTTPSRSSPASVSSKPQVPPIPSSFSELEQKSLSELRELNEDPDAFDRFVESLSWTREISRITDDLTSRSTQLAESNMRDGDTVNQVQQRVAELREKVDAIRPEVEELEQRQQRIMHQYSRESLLSRLQSKIGESEAVTESLASDFIRPGSEHSMEDFIKEYREQRFTYHMRQLKKERFESSSQHPPGGPQVY
eukprot:gb/GECH01012097.1/.p1 GENE.gb/GECH01012097.1/~~gb/GECH01012097.1/.p1  ORF type:complete len:342 (+),score=90.52 gb/GECH01012097.1/:1-1026(+)